MNSASCEQYHNALFSFGCRYFELVIVSVLGVPSPLGTMCIFRCFWLEAVGFSPVHQVGSLSGTAYFRYSSSYGNWIISYSYLGSRALGYETPTIQDHPWIFVSIRHYVSKWLVIIISCINV